MDAKLGGGGWVLSRGAARGGVPWLGRQAIRSAAFHPLCQPWLPLRDNRDAKWCALSSPRPPHHHGVTSPRALGPLAEGELHVDTSELCSLLLRSSPGRGHFPKPGV